MSVISHWIGRHRRLSIVLLLATFYLLLCVILYPLESRKPIAGSSTSAVSLAHMDDVSYHGGHVQTSPTSYLIFWGNSWRTNGQLSMAAQFIESYFTHVGGTPFSNILTQYYMSNPNGSRASIANSMRFAISQLWIDPVEPTRDNTNCGGPTLEDSAIQQEIERAIQQRHWPPNSQNATYFVYPSTPYFIEEPGFGCADQAQNQPYCGDHEWSRTLHLAYAVIPYPKNQQCTSIQVPPAIRDNEAHRILYSLVLVSSHEQFEAITDPNAARPGDMSDANRGWYYRDKNNDVVEIGDLCISDGQPRALNGTVFMLQAMWSYRAGRCIWQ